MPGRIRKRWGLIVLVMLGQLVCLLTAVAVFDAWLTRRLRQTVRERVLLATQQTANHVATLIGQLNIRDLTAGSDDWQRLQSIVEQTHLPNRGYLCVIDRDTGRILSHPDLPNNPALANMKLGRVLLHSRKDTRPILDPNAPPGAIRSGWAQMPDGTDLVTVRDLPNVNAKLLVHHREAGLNQVISAFVLRVRAAGIVVTVILVLLTAVVTAMIVRQYEGRLERINAGLEDKVAERSEALLRSRDAVIFGLAKLADARDDQTGQHLERISRYVEILARQLAKTNGQLNERWVRTVSTTSVLHDIGKVGIHDAILLKPGPLTDDERHTVRKHTYIGGDTLLELKRRWGDDPFLVTATEIALSHHERWDGQGYPFGLAGDDIPLAARIVALADVYDALTSDRVYRQAMPHDDARKIIIEQAGAHFDPDVVEAFVKVEHQFKAAVATTV
ncbi:MAG: HD domain-containing phosphohydrolase [Phycisphaeraceae bacterium]